MAGEFAAQWGGLRLERALNAFTGRLTGRRRVLDLGCGPGRDLEFLAELGCRPVGLDLSAGMLAEARRRLPAAPLVLADLRLTPFAAGCFDGIWACASLLHLRRADLPLSLVEAGRLLRRPGGMLYLALKRGEGERWVVDTRGRRSFFAYYQLPEIEAALQQADFQVLDHWLDPNQAGQPEPWVNLIARLSP